MKEWVKEAINTFCTAESRPGDHKADLADQIRGEADFEFVKTTLTALLHRIQKKVCFVVISLCFFIRDHR